MKRCARCGLEKEDDEFNWRWIDDTRTAEHGNAWATMVNNIANAIYGYRYQITIAGGSDIELGWNSPSKTMTWVNAYRATANSLFFNVGDAQDCPQTRPEIGFRLTDGLCGGIGPWHQSDIYNVSSQGVLPLVYFYENSLQWYSLAAYVFDNHSGDLLNVKSSVTEYYSCNLHQDCQPGYLTAENGWTWLAYKIYYDPDTRPIFSNITWSTDIKFFGE